MKKDSRLNIESTLADIQIAMYQKNETLATIFYCRAMKQIHDAKKTISNQDYQIELNKLQNKYNI